MNDDLTAGPNPALVRQAYRKRKVGQALTPEERKPLALQQKTHANRRTVVYFESDEQMAEWQARGKAQNYTSFSQWIVDRVQRAEQGGLVDPVEHGRMQQRLQTMQADTEYARQKTHDLEAENRELRAEIRRLTSEITEMTHWIRQKFGNQPVGEEKAAKGKGSR